MPVCISAAARSSSGPRTSTRSTTRLPISTRHYVSAGPVADPAHTAELARAAGDEGAERYAHEEAVAWYGHAIDAAIRAGWSDGAVAHVRLDLGVALAARRRARRGPERVHDRGRDRTGHRRSGSLLRCGAGRHTGVRDPRSELCGPTRTARGRRAGVARPGRPPPDRHAPGRRVRRACTRSPTSWRPTPTRQTHSDAQPSIHWRGTGR